MAGREQRKTIALGRRGELQQDKPQGQGKATARSPKDDIKE